MSEDFLPKIYDAFTRVNSSTVSGIQGTGLGMAITKNIVDMMDGSIDIKSKVDEGTDVVLNFKFALAGAEHELERLHVKERAILKHGDALKLETSEKISFVMLDAPCSGSGTWNRKPESKWRLDWKKFDSLVEMQKKLLDRALSLCSGGYVLYITCSLLRGENENVIGEALTSHPKCTEISNLIEWKGNEFKKGKPYGIYIWPSNPWLDGFYCALIMKK